VSDLHWKLPLRGDSMGAYILDADGTMVAQMRGWGHLTGTGGLRLDGDTAVDVQKARQIEIVHRVNTHDEVVDLLRGMIGLVQLIQSREPDLEKNHRFVDALAFLERHGEPR
jgi:hypothetical protein